MLLISEQEKTPLKVCEVYIIAFLHQICNCPMQKFHHKGSKMLNDYFVWIYKKFNTHVMKKSNFKFFAGTLTKSWNNQIRIETLDFGVDELEPSHQIW